MPDASRKRLRGFTIIYTMLLLYVIAALVWWFISLSNQNYTMRNLRTTSLNASIDSLKTPFLFQTELHKISDEYNRNQTKYIGEGSIFLLLILIGAAFLYRSGRRQFYMQHQQQNFMMAVTHELKTPISVAKLNLETLQKHTLDAEKQKKLIQMTLQETSRLDFLTNNILIASQLDSGGYRSSKDELDLSDLFMDCINNFKNRYPDRILIDQIETGTDVSGDALLLQMLINNLLENANKYSPIDAPIKTILQKTNSNVTLSIIDEGIGIPDSEKKKIFTKFYRIGNENTRKTQGTGLGLYLCNKIARDHNADIVVTNNTPHGSNFAVTLPRTK
ncbi:MAG: two-component sensor histidine kinase [Bacteroidia bacterium]|nr:two-component sensor histidine kinase [Bacteroidia bacterium]